MLNTNYTAKLLDLEDVIITNVERSSDYICVYIELPRAEHICPDCGKKTERIHDYRMQTIKDIPLGKKTVLHLRKRRYRCAHCNQRFFPHFLSNRGYDDGLPHLDSPNRFETAPSHFLFH